MTMCQKRFIKSYQSNTTDFQKQEWRHQDVDWLSFQIMLQLNMQ